MKSLRIILILFILSLFPLQIVKASGASFSVFPQTGSFTQGNTFEISVFMNTGNENVNVAEVGLSFDPKMLQVITPTKGVSIIGEWIFPPSFSNSKGTISLVGGFLYDGINTSEGLITTIVFEAISQGQTEINFLNSSKILVGKEDGKNILTSINKGVFTLLPPPFKGPQVFSETHPDQNKWYKNNSPSFNWEKSEEEGYSFILDDDPYGEPDNIIDSDNNSVSFENTTDGILYFHVKARKNLVWGGTSHFKVNIDSTEPLAFEPYSESFMFTPGDNLLVYFSTKDALSEIDHYNVRVNDISDANNIIFSGWIRQDSPYAFATNRSGNYELEVRAFDKAGNFAEGKIGLRVINPFFIITSKGIQMKILFISWWQIWVLFFVTVFVLFLTFFVLIKNKGQDMKIKLQKEIEEAEKEIDDVKKAQEKIEKMRQMEEKAGSEWQRLKGKLDDVNKKDG